MRQGPSDPTHFPTLRHDIITNEGDFCIEVIETIEAGAYLDLEAPVPTCNLYNDDGSPAPEPALLVATFRARDLELLGQYGVNMAHAVRRRNRLERCLLSIPVARTLEQVWAESQDVPVFVALPSVGALAWCRAEAARRDRLELPLRAWLTPCLLSDAEQFHEHGLRVYVGATGLEPLEEAVSM